MASWLRLAAAVVVVSLVAAVIVWQRSSIAGLARDVENTRVRLEATRSELASVSEQRDETAVNVERERRELREAEADVAALRRARITGCVPGLYQIGFQGPLSGPYQGVGEIVLDGVDMAIHQAKQEELVLPSGRSLPPGVSLNARTLDTQGDAERGSHGANLAVDEDRMLAVIGPTFSGEAMTAGPIYDEANMPFVTASASQTSLSRQGWASFFRTGGHDDAQAAAASRFIVRELEARRVAVVDDGTPYGQYMADAAERSLRELGATIAARITLQARRSQYRNDAAQIAAADADAVYFGGYFDEAGVLRRDVVARAGKDVEFVSDDGAFDGDFFDRAGSAAAGAYVLFHGTDPQLAPPKFAAEFEAFYGYEPGVFTYDAYVSTALVIDAIVSSGCSRSKIVRHLREFSGTVAGKKIEFTGNGDMAAPAFTLYRARQDWWDAETIIR